MADQSNSRRKFLKNMMQLGAAGSIAATGVPLTQAAWQENQQQSGAGQKLAVIGSGMGGIAAAWLCESGWDVELFESRSKVGGHCDSVSVEYEGVSMELDLGAQFFHPDTHPLYVSLLEEIGLYSESDPHYDRTLEATGSLSIPSLDDGNYLFNSKNAHWRLITALNFANFTRLARNYVLEKGSYEVTLEDWVKSLPLTRYFKNRILLPWMSSMIGCTIADAKRTSARSILQAFALTYPENLCDGATTLNSSIGLGGNLQHLMTQCQNTRLWLNAGITDLRKENGQWFLQTKTGEYGPYDQIIINAPPRIARHWFSQIPSGDVLSEILGRFEYFDSRIVIHSDPTYVVEKPEYWCLYNAGIENSRTDAETCEGSVWLGGVHEEIPGEHKSLFKSWVTRRGHEPKNKFYERTFQHPLITPQAIGASRDLRQWQGHEGLWFSGNFTTGMDLQEAALYSAVQVAKQINPHSTRMAALNNRLANRGISEVNYDL